MIKIEKIQGLTINPPQLPQWWKIAAIIAIAIMASKIDRTEATAIVKTFFTIAAKME